MEALISGSAGLAAIINGNTASLINCKGDTLCSSTYSNITRQFSLYEDTIHLRSTDSKKALTKLNVESLKSDSLLLVLSVLDENISCDLKDDLYINLNELLSDELILKYIQGILFSRPLPKHTISVVPETLKKYPIVNNLIEELLSSQECVSKIYDLWTETAEKFSVEPEHIIYIEGVFAVLGVGYKLSRSPIPRNTTDILQFECLSKLKNIQNNRQIIKKLFDSYKSSIESDKKVTIQVESKKFKHKDKSSTPSIATHEIYGKVNSQISKITTLLKNGDINAAKKIKEELISSQKSRHDNSFAAKSLCKLSEEAKSIFDFELQLEWSLEAVDIYPDDKRSYGHVADAYLNLNQLENSRIWFDRAIHAGDGSFAKCGLARVERNHFNYEKAFKLVNEVIDEGYNEYSNLTLKAELLRDLERLDEAADLYEQLSQDFPEYSRAMCGVAAIKADQRNFREAEIVYRKCIELYPDDIDNVAYSSLGFLLAKQGRFAEGFKLLDKGISLGQTRNFKPQMIKARAFRMRGQYIKAESIYRTLINTSDYYIESRVELVDVLLNDNRYDEALVELNIAKEKYPDNEKIKRSEALLLNHNSNFEGALKIFDEIKLSHPRWVLSLLDRARLLKQLGQYVESRKQYEEILAIRKNERRAVTGIKILDALAKKEPSGALIEHDYDPVTIDDWHDLNIKGLLLLSQNRFKEAKELLLNGFNNNPFKVNKEEFSLSLSVARTMLGQYGTAIQTIKSPRTDVGFIQQAIIYGEQGKLDKVDDSISKLQKDRPDTSNVINLISERYASIQKGNDEYPSIEKIIGEQVNTILRAA